MNSSESFRLVVKNVESLKFIIDNIEIDTDIVNSKNNLKEQSVLVNKQSNKNRAKICCSFGIKCKFNNEGICKYYHGPKCTFGANCKNIPNNCNYGHTLDDLKNNLICKDVSETPQQHIKIPNKSNNNTQLKSPIKAMCLYGSSCKLHVEKKCKFYHGNVCTRGSNCQNLPYKCNYGHTLEEITEKLICKDVIDTNIQPLLKSSNKSNNNTQNKSSNKFNNNTQNKSSNKSNNNTQNKSSNKSNNNTQNESSNNPDDNTQIESSNNLVDNTQIETSNKSNDKIPINANCTADSTSNIFDEDNANSKCEEHHYIECPNGSKCHKLPYCTFGHTTHDIINALKSCQSSNV